MEDDVQHVVETKQMHNMFGILCGAAIGAFLGYVVIDNERRKRTFEFFHSIRREIRGVYNEFRRYSDHFSENETPDEEKQLLAQAN